MISKYNLDNGIANYAYPFQKTNPRDYDYLDYGLLANKGAVLIGDWDTPVKWKKVVRSTVAPPLEDINNSTTDNINYAQTSYNIRNPGEITLQDYFPDSDSFYESAAQRQLVFVDATTEEGRNSLGLNETRKKRIAFSRLDIHFYGPPTSAQYPLPKGITDIKSVLTVDRYPNIIGGGSVKTKEGYFSSDSENKTEGWFFNEYNNPFYGNTDKLILHWDDPCFPVQKTHYLYPINLDLYPSDLEGFDETGGLAEYSDIVKLVRPHTTNMLIPPETSRIGGKIVVELLNFTFLGDPIQEEFVSFSADQISIYKTVYDAEDNTIIAYFKRGQMPNEAYGRPSIVYISLENLDTEFEEITLPTSVYFLSWDFTLDSREYYEIIPDQNRTELNYTKTPFFSLPAVKLEFRVNTNTVPFECPVDEIVNNTANENSTSTERNVDYSFLNSNSKFYGYEYKEPWIRYGVYYQELLNHTTVWGVAEVHPVYNDPGTIIILI